MAANGAHPVDLSFLNEIEHFVRIICWYMWQFLTEMKDLLFDTSMTLDHPMVQAQSAPLCN